MSSRLLRAQALAALLALMMSGCAVVGLGYRAGHTRTSGKSEAARLTQLAQLYERQGHPSGAMRLYRQALHADPRSQQARERLMALSSHMRRRPTRRCSRSGRQLRRR
jgi:Tfp pilus assembly protein PilF